MSLPRTGLVYVDSVCFIYSVEPHPVYSPLLRTLWNDMAAERLQVVTSELTLMEVLVGAHRSGDSKLETDYRRALNHTSIGLQSTDQTILTEAAKLRAVRSGLRTPDAIHLPTAALAGCDTFVTNDKSLRSSFSGIVVLDDLL